MRNQYKNLTSLYESINNTINNPFDRTDAPINSSSGSKFIITPKGAFHGNGTPLLAAEIDPGWGVVGLASGWVTNDNSTYRSIDKEEIPPRLDMKNSVKYPYYIAGLEGGTAYLMKINSKGEYEPVLQFAVTNNFQNTWQLLKYHTSWRKTYLYNNPDYVGTYELDKKTAEEFYSKSSDNRTFGTRPFGAYVADMAV